MDSDSLLVQVRRTLLMHDDNLQRCEMRLRVLDVISGAYRALMCEPAEAGIVLMSQPASRGSTQIRWQSQAHQEDLRRAIGRLNQHPQAGAYLAQVVAPDGVGIAMLLRHDRLLDQAKLCVGNTIWTRAAERAAERADMPCSFPRMQVC